MVPFLCSHFFSLRKAIFEDNFVCELIKREWMEFLVGLKWLGGGSNQLIFFRSAICDMTNIFDQRARFSRQRMVSLPSPACHSRPYRYTVYCTEIVVFFASQNSNCGQWHPGKVFSRMWIRSNPLSMRSRPLLMRSNLLLMRSKPLLMRSHRLWMRSYPLFMKSSRCGWDLTLCGW
jgi:hypothetical protein